MINKSHLIEYFYKGIKDKNNLKIGVEHEKFVLNKNNYNQVNWHYIVITTYKLKRILISFTTIQQRRSVILRIRVF